MADTLVKKPKLIVGTQAQVEAEIGDNDIGFATDIEFYNKAEIDEQYTSIITYVGDKDREIKSDITQLDTNIRTVGDWVNAKDSEGNRATLTTEAQDAYRAINELNAKIGEGGGGGDCLPLSGGTLTGAIEFEWSGQYMATQNVVLKTKYNRTDTGSTELRNVLTVDPTGSAYFYSTVFSDQVFPKSTGATGLTTTLGNKYYLWRNVYTTRLNAGYQNGADSGDLIVPTEGGTLARLEDLEGIGGASLPILMTMWSDHVINDMSWLRADTFSWQSGDVYKAAYEHLANDVGEVWYAWAEIGGGYWYTKTPTVSVGDTVYSDDFSVYGQVSAASSDTKFYVGPEVFHRSAENDIPAHKTDIIGDITITYYLAQDGHKICFPDQESNIVALYEQTGAADYYLLDTTNKQFKLPRKQKRKFIQAVKNTDGTWYNLYSNGWVEQGGQIIRGSITFEVPMADINYNVSGAQIRSGSTNGTYYNAFKFVNMRETGIDLDNVQSEDPLIAWKVCGYAAESAYASAGMNLEYYYVGNFEQSAIEQTAGLNAELFNGKADVSRVETLEGYDYVVQSQLPTADNSYTWYRKYKSGWVEQGGVSALTKEATITLPVAMQDAQYTISLAGFAFSNTDPSVANIKDNSQTTTGFVIQHKNNRNEAYSNKSYWYACGQAS